MGILSTLKVLFVKKFFSETAKHSASEPECFTEFKTKGTKVEKNITNKFLQTQFTTRSEGCQDWILQIKGSILQILCRFWVLMWLFWLSSMVGWYREGGLGGFVILAM